MVQSSWFNFTSSNFVGNSTSTTIVRSARTDDIIQMGEILTCGFYQFNDFTSWIYPLLRLGICQDVRGRIEDNDPNIVCLVAVTIDKIGKEISQKVVGTVELSFRSRSHWHNYQRYAYISNLAVSKNYRRQGIANKLLQKCEQIVKDKKITNLRLHVLAQNKIAQQLYLKNGYYIEQVETDLYSLFVTSKRRLLLTKVLK